MTRLKMKYLTDVEIHEYLQYEEWKGKAGGYALQGYSSKFIQWINGSYSGVIGLPLYELKNLLITSGWKKS